MGKGGDGMRWQGFTLVELLTVIAVIAVLAGIILTVIVTARAKAWQAQCISHLRQIGMALHQYLNDHDEAFPVPDELFLPMDECAEIYEGHLPYQGVGLRTYADQLFPYVRAGNIWVCPATTEKVVPPRRYQPGSPWSSYHYRHYFLVGFHYFCPYEPLVKWVKGYVPRLPQFPAPSRIFGFHELSVYHRWALTRNPNTGWTEWSPTAGMQFAFLDGHVKLVSVGQILVRASWWKDQGWDYHWPRNGWEVEPIIGKPDL